MNFNLGELFCGPGGIGYAASKSEVTKNYDEYKISPSWANDYDKDTCKTYENNIGKHYPHHKIICKDIRKLDIESLPPIDAFAFGFPCNDFSIIGEQKGMEGVYGPLYSYGLKVIKTFKPLWFLAENVGGLKNANDGSAFQKILDDLFNSGYDVFPHLYKFEEYGVPQARHRIIIIGLRNDLNLTFKIPQITTPKSITCFQAITNPPIPTDATNNELTRQSNQVIDRLKYIKPGENVFTANMPQNLRLNVKGAKISQIYKRLDPSKPAYTVTGSGGGGTHVYHWEENRALTNRERARLQTFPDEFIFSGSKESVRKQIGMAVPPLGAKVIFEAVLKTFAQIPYSCKEPNFPSLIHNRTNNKNIPVTMEVA